MSYKHWSVWLILLRYPLNMNQVEKFDQVADLPMGRITYEDPMNIFYCTTAFRYLSFGRTKGTNFVYALSFGLAYVYHQYTCTWFSFCNCMNPLSITVKYRFNGKMLTSLSPLFKNTIFALSCNLVHLLIPD